MSTKTQVQEYAATHPRFTVREVTEALELNISTVRKAVASLVTESELNRENDILVQTQVATPATTTTRTHNKPKIKDILAPRFAAALDGIDIVIPTDASPEEKRNQKALIKAALDTITFGNTLAEVADAKGFTKYTLSHLKWYKSQYLRHQRVLLSDTESTPISDVG